MKSIVTDSTTDYIFVTDFSALRDHLNRLSTQACITRRPRISTTSGRSVSGTAELPHTGSSMSGVSFTATYQPSGHSGRSTTGLSHLSTLSRPRWTSTISESRSFTTGARSSRRTRPSTRGLPPHFRLSTSKSYPTHTQSSWTSTISESRSFTTGSQAPRRTRPSTPGLPPHWMLSTSQSYLTHTQQSRTSWNPAQLLSSTAAPSGSPASTFIAQSFSPLTLSGSRSSSSNIITRTGSTKSVAITTPGLIPILLN